MIDHSSIYRISDLFSSAVRILLSGYSSILNSHALSDHIRSLHFSLSVLFAFLVWEKLKECFYMIGHGGTVCCTPQSNGTTSLIAAPRGVRGNEIA